jgi:hypothetical protein
LVKGFEVYVTVLVTTCFTLTFRDPPADMGGAPKTLVRPSIYQLVGEKGERSGWPLRGVALCGVCVLGAALRGVALCGDWLKLVLVGDSGIVSFLSVVGVLADGRLVGAGLTKGDGGTRGADVAEGSFRFSSSAAE